MTVFYLNKCSLFLWWQIWVFSSRYSRLQRHITSFIFLSHFQVPTCSRDSGHHQVPAYGARSALWSPHYGKQREPRYCCQLHTVIYHFICLLGKTDPLYYCFVCRVQTALWILYYLFYVIFKAYRIAMLLICLCLSQGNHSHSVSVSWGGSGALPTHVSEGTTLRLSVKPGIAMCLLIGSHSTILKARCKSNFS